MNPLLFNLIYACVRRKFEFQIDGTIMDLLPKEEEEGDGEKFLILLLIIFSASEIRRDIKCQSRESPA